MKPISANTAYIPGDAWPLDRINRSLSSHFGWSGRTRIRVAYSAEIKSISDNEPPG